MFFWTRESDGFHVYNVVRNHEGVFRANFRYENDAQFFCETRNVPADREWKTVRIVEVGPKAISVIKLIRKYTSTPLKEAKYMVDTVRDGKEVKLTLVNWHDFTVEMRDVGATVYTV